MAKQHNISSNDPSPEAIEAMATRLASYMNTIAEDSEYAAKYRGAYESAVAAMGSSDSQLASPQGTLSPYSLLRQGDDVDEYLATADAEIERISKMPILSMKEYVPSLCIPILGQADPFLKPC